MQVILFKRNIHCINSIVVNILTLYFPNSKGTTIMQHKHIWWTLLHTSLTSVKDPFGLGNRNVNANGNENENYKDGNEKDVWLERMCIENGKRWSGDCYEITLVPLL